jgi:CBS domain-containing protein
MFRLDEDLSGFYALVQKDELSWCALGAGRMLRAPTVFEDVVKTICSSYEAFLHKSRAVSGSGNSTLAQATHCYVRSLQTCDYSLLPADKHSRPELAASGRANAYPPTAHRASVLIEVMPETTEETPKGGEMGTKVADVMTQRPRAVTPQTPLNEVAEVMETEDVGAVPLVEGDRLVGIVTDRDIVVRAIAKGKDPRGMPASEVSSRELLTVSPDDDLSDALKVMAQYQVRRLAVTAEDDRLVGVVSQADIALQGKDKDTGQVLEGISRQPQGPRTP